MSVREQEARDRAETVLEAMSQDSGPADCEPFTGWARDLARDVLGLLDENADYEGYGEIMEALTRERDAALADAAVLRDVLREAKAFAKLPSPASVDEHARWDAARRRLLAALAASPVSSSTGANDA